MSRTNKRPFAFVRLAFAANIRCERSERSFDGGPCNRARLAIDDVKIEGEEGEFNIKEILDVKDID